MRVYDTKGVFEVYGWIIHLFSYGCNAKVVGRRSKFPCALHGGNRTIMYGYEDSTLHLGELLYL